MSQTAAKNLSRVLGLTASTRQRFERQRQAYLLRTQQGLSDQQIADALKVSRETANRLVNRYLRRERETRLACTAGVDCLLLSLL